MLIFRADGNSDIGAGHVMRCLSIADAADEPCLFVAADENFSAAITGRGHGILVLNTDYSHMEQELGNFEDIVKRNCPSAVFVDSYFVTPGYLRRLQEICREISCKTVYIDDVLAFPYPVDYLINYNIYGPDKREEYERMYLRTGTELPCFLLGTEFAPLREEFQNLPDRAVKKRAKEILISTGGADPEHISVGLTGYIIENFCRERRDNAVQKKDLKDENENQRNDFHFHLIIGAMNRDLATIQKMAEGIPVLTLRYNVTNMQELMFSCDVAVSAAGSTLYELCATQTPVVTYILADNQIPGAEGFERHGVLTCAGDMRNLGVEKLAANLIEAAMELAGNYEERVRIASVQKGLVDGKGAARILERIKYPEQTGKMT